MAATYDVEAARAQFPALQQEQVFMDNVGSLPWYGVSVLSQIYEIYDLS